MSHHIGSNDCCPRWKLTTEKASLSSWQHDPQCPFQHQDTWADVARHAIDAAMEWWEKRQATSLRDTSTP